MARIYVANYSPTNEYTGFDDLGELVYVTEGIIKHHPNKLHNIFRRAFEPATEQDYLLLTGSTMVTCIAYAEWTRKFPQTAVFLWDRFDRKYRLHQVDSTNAQGT